MRKYLNILVIVLFAITLVILGLFIFGGNIPNQEPQAPVYTSALLNWAYILTFICVIAAVAFPIYNMFSSPKKAIKSLIAIGLIVIVVIIAYALADGTPLVLQGYTGTDNTPTMVKFSDTVIKTMYILFAAAILAVVGSEIYKRIK